MNAIKTVAKEVKVAIAVEAVKTPGTKAIVLATQFNVSESTVRRAIKEFEAEAKALIEAEAKAQADAATKPVKAKRVKTPTVPTGPLGYKGRNGRWNIINSVISELGYDAEFSTIYVEVCKRSVAQGLTELNKNSFRAMFAYAKKNAKK